MSAGRPAIHQNEVHVSPRKLRKAKVMKRLNLFTPALSVAAEVIAIVVTCHRVFRLAV
jgi:hypothetical protein